MKISTTNKKLIEFLNEDIFKYAIELQLMKNNHKNKKGDSWKTCDLNYLMIEKFQEEYWEYRKSYSEMNRDYIMNCSKYNKDLIIIVQKELIDLSLISNFIWNRLEKLK